MLKNIISAIVYRTPKYTDMTPILAKADIMPLLLIKFIAFIFIFFTGILGGVISLKIAESKRHNKLFALGTSFSAGIFLGAGLIHMLPDAVKNYAQTVKSAFPWAFFLCALGFLLLLFIENIFLDKHHNIQFNDSDHDSPLTPYLLAIILSIHSVITGVSLGTENTLSLTLILFLAVIAHKGSAAFALATNLIKSQFNKSKIMYIIIFFSLMTPIGIIIGAILDKVLPHRSEHIVEGLFDSMAAGTFLYISIVNLLNKEFNIKKYIGAKIFFVALGFSLMTILAFYLKV